MTALSDDADPVSALTAQVNRFGPSAPSNLRFAQQQYPITPVLDPAVAMAAVLIYQRRATDAYNQMGDRGSADAIAKANQGLADPVGWVTANLADVTQVIAAYGDINKLPPATLPDAGTGMPGSGPDLSTLLLIAGIGIAAWMLFSR
jgi:hypothetical protein